MTTKEHFNQCRRRLWDLLTDTDFSYGCKRYEGLIEVLQSYPTYFDSPDDLPAPEKVTIRLYCYVLGGHRQYDFTGNTFPQAIMKFDKWLTKIETEERANKKEKQ